MPTNEFLFLSPVTCHLSPERNMSEKLSIVEARILGALIEKQLTTPEYYPLTLNALVAACNQKTNREPVFFFTKETVEKALDVLREKNLVYVFYGSTSRVPKYKHLLPKYYEIDERETAIICVLLLRGAQTLCELRERTGRIYEFSGLAEVGDTLDELIKRETPLVAKLERQPGQKEARYVQLLAEETAAPPLAASAASNSPDNEKIEKLETEVETLRTELNELRETFETFKKQFE